MKTEHYNISGCNLKTPDKRNFKLGQVFNLPKLKEIPSEFCLPKRPIKDQRNTDKCTAYASCSASELQEDVELNPDFTFAVGKDIEGKPDEWGCDIESMLKAHTKIGAIEQKDVPQNFVPNSTEARYLKNWSTDLVEKAHLNKKETYFQVKGKYDAFDDIRASLWAFRDKKQAVLLGVVWSWGNKTYIDDIDDDGQGHAIAVIGWKKHKGKDYLIIQNSYGENFGDKGYNYLSREVINHYVDMYGAYMLVDMAREDAEWYINNKIKKDDNWLVQFFKLAIGNKLLTLLKELLFRQQQKEKTMNDLQPLLKRKLEEFKQKCEAEGLPIKLVEGFRSIERQNELYAQGRTKPGNIVTNAKGGQSYHNYGCAFDVNFVKGDWNVPNSQWEKIGLLGEELGLEWGGRWAGFSDKPHFQITFGYSYDDFIKGRVDYSKFN